ncbi:MAG: AEC family transporter, partial [Candidatus Heimdallarchaeaceae archaeon]
MHYIVDLALRVLWIYGGITLGFLLRYVPKSERIGKVLTFIGLNILTPILLIVVLLGIDAISSHDWLFFVLVSVLSTIGSLVIDYAIIRKKEGMTLSEKGAELSAVAFMNSLFFPFPIIIGLVGIDGLFAASIWVIANIVVRNTLGVYIGVKYGKAEHKSFWKILKEIFLFPPTLGVLVGLILRFAIGNIETGDILALNIFRDITTFIMLALVGL